MERVMPVRTAALVAGISLLLMAVLAGLANFGVIEGIAVRGDAEATASNLEASAGLVRFAAGALILVVILDVVVAWGLYVLLRGVSPSLSLLGAWFRVVYAAAFAVAIMSIFAALHAAPEDPNRAVFLMQSFNDGWQVALTVFAAHLCVVGALVWRAEFVSWIFGLLLLLSGAGYFIDGLGTLLFPGYALGLSSFTFAGEVVFMLWLLIRGSRLR